MMPPPLRDAIERVARGETVVDRSNTAIARTLHLGEKTVETHITSVMTKLDLESTPDNNRRVLAVLTWMRAIDK